MSYKRRYLEAIVKLQLAEELFSHVHDCVHHRNRVLLKLRASLVFVRGIEAETLLKVKHELIC